MKTCYCRSFLEYKYIQRESTGSHFTVGKTMPQLDILCHQIKPPVPEIGYIFFLSLAKHYRILPMHWLHSQQRKWLGPVTECHRQQTPRNQGGTQKFCPYWLMFMVLEGATRTTGKVIVSSHITMNPASHNDKLPPRQIHWCDSKWHKHYRSDQPLYCWVQGPLHIRPWDQTKSWIQGGNKPSATFLINEHSSKMTPDDILL